MLQECFKDHSKNFQGCFKRGPRMFQGCFLEISMGFPECFKGVSRKFQDMFKVFQGTHRLHDLRIGLHLKVKSVSDSIKSSVTFLVHVR